jgi:hypothetical protein
MKILVGIIGSTIILSSLIGCLHLTAKEQITATSTAVIDAIRKGDSPTFEAMISSLGTIDRDVIRQDVVVYQRYLRKYYPVRNPPIEITDLFNTHGQQLVKIPIFQDPKDSLIKKGDLRLLFGPTNQVPLSKISGYEVREMDKVDSIDYHPSSYWQTTKDAYQ